MNLNKNKKMITITDKKTTKRLEISEKFLTFTNNVYKPRFINFYFDFEGDGNIAISGLDFESWFDSLIGDKMVIAVDGDLPENFPNEVLIVENDGLPYIVKTLYEIINALLPETIKLVSLSYDEII